MPDTRSLAPASALLPSHWLRSNLAALGSAAVLTVYAAGWARTKAAADLLDEQSERRLPPHRPAARAAVGQVEGTPVARTREAAAPQSPPASASAVATAATPTVTPRSTSVAEKAAAEPAPTSKSATTVASIAQPKAASAPPPSKVAASTAAPNVVAANVAANVAASPAPVATFAPTVAVPTPAPASTPTPTAPVKPTTQAAPIVPGAPRELATDAQATTSAAKAADASSGPVTFKDGLYSGWGTSRHGDIEAYVEIKGGRIKSAFIGECLTQYSCSWISKLPGWVIEAQSAETDYISGATHSSNAFYYAIVNALKKATK